MANEPSKVPRPFDMRTIKELVALMGRHDLTEVDLREGELRIRLRRGPKETIMLSPTPAAMVPASTPASPPATPAAAKSADAPAPTSARVGGPVEVSGCGRPAPRRRPVRPTRTPGRPPRRRSRRPPRSGDQYL